MRSVFVLLIRGYQLAISTTIASQLPLLSNVLGLRARSVRATWSDAGMRLTVAEFFAAHPFRPGATIRFPEWISVSFSSLSVAHRIAISQLLFPSSARKPTAKARLEVTLFRG